MENFGGIFRQYKLEKMWLCLFQYCILNKIKELHFKILHNFCDENL